MALSSFLFKIGNPLRSVPLFLPKEPVPIYREETQRGISFFNDFPAKFQTYKNKLK